MKDYNDLVEQLKAKLLVYKYVESDEGDINDIQFISVIKTKRVWMVRLLCAIVEVPQNISDASEVIVFFNKIRNALITKYAKFPYIKELGTFLVLLCDNDLYQKLMIEKPRLKDLTGFQSNVMLGNCIINKNTFENSADSTWGLFHSGKHFDSIHMVVSEWCEANKK